MRSSANARRFGAFSASLLAGAAVLLFHTAASAQQSAPKTTQQDNAAKDEAAKDADAAKDTGKEPAAAPEAGDKAQNPNELPPGYGPPPGYRNAPPPPHGYPRPPEGPYEQGPYQQGPYQQGPYQQGPYQHDYYYGPPPAPYGYGYPPPYRRYAPPPPARYYPEPLRYRPFFFGFGLGVSGVGEYLDGGPKHSRVGIGYDLRIGFGVSPRWSLVLAADGGSAYFNGVNLSETVFTVGPQVFVTNKLYLRAGIGAASRTYDYNDGYDSYGYYYASRSDSGMGAVAAVGVEFLQSYHVALAVEANGTVGLYPDPDKGTMSTFGINFVVNLF